MNSIQIRVPRPAPAITGVIRLSRDAEEVIRDLQIQTGLAASNIVSQIILQAADQIEIVRDE